jgi:hypothetical protein
VKEPSFCEDTAPEAWNKSPRLTARDRGGTPKAG